MARGPQTLGEALLGGLAGGLQFYGQNLVPYKQWQQGRAERVQLENRRIDESMREAAMQAEERRLAAHERLRAQEMGDMRQAAESEATDRYRTAMLGLEREKLNKPDVPNTLDQALILARQNNKPEDVAYYEGLLREKRDAGQLKPLTPPQIRAYQDAVIKTKQNALVAPYGSLSVLSNMAATPSADTTYGFFDFGNKKPIVKPTGQPLYPEAVNDLAHYKALQSPDSLAAARGQIPTYYPDVVGRIPGLDSVGVSAPPTNTTNNSEAVDRLDADFKAGKIDQARYEKWRAYYLNGGK